MAASRSLPVIGLALAALLTLAACGGSSKDAAKDTPAPTVTTSSATSESTSAAPSASATGSESSASTSDPGTPAPADTAACSNATVEVNKATNALPESESQLVLDIEIEGACVVSVKTGFTQDTASSALKVCQASEAPAYANGATGVNVEGNGTVLAAGTKSSPCALNV